MSISNIIFDLDGTLTDTGRDIAEALNHAIAPVGLEPMEIADVTALVGGGIPNLIMKALGPTNLHRADKTRERFVHYYETHLTGHTKPYPGVTDTLTSLKAAGMKMAVLSNKNEAMSEEILRRLEMLDYFEFVIGGDTADEKKPRPGGVLQSMRLLGARPNESVLVGDSSFDIDAAHAAKVQCVAVAYGFRPRTTLLDADVLIDRFTDLLAAIKGLDGTL